MDDDNIFDEGVYTPFEWKDGLDDYTPITAERLNHIEQGIKGLSKSISQLFHTETIEVPKSAFNPANINAPDVDGYNFLCWVATPAPQGNNIATFAFTNAFSKSTSCWQTSGGNTYNTARCFALYVKNFD